METMTSSAKHNHVTRDRALRLFSYLKELSELRTKTVRDLENYEKILWFSDIPRISGWHCAAWEDDGIERSDTWVEVGRPPARTPPPIVPPTLQPWIIEETVGDSSRKWPEIRQQIELEATSDGDGIGIGTEELGRNVATLSEHVNIREQWDEYVETLWWAWAEKDQQISRAHTVYADLFSLYQRQQRLGEQFEVVLGIGLLRWQTPNGHTVNRHLVTAQTAISFDPVRGKLTIGPSGEGAKPGIEQDMLEAQERPDSLEQQSVEHLLTEMGDDVWEPSGWDDLLSAWVHAVSPQGRYVHQLSAENGASSDPVVSFAPALILRRRTERSLIRVFQDIIDQLSADEPLPIGILRLVDVVDDDWSLDPLQASETTSDPEGREIFFPLPANDEQTSIVHRLRSRQGVLVQGPPGTGKSHTIVNLLCHLLATGKRVLVTSHTPRALAVLRGKMPPEIASLCVSVLGNDATALQNLEDSVHGITDRFDRWDPDRNRLTIERLRKQLDEARRKQSLAETQLREIREKETYIHNLPYGDYSGTAVTIAKRVAAEESRYSWFPVTPPETDDPPLTTQEARDLLHFIRAFPAERIAAEMSFAPPSTELPTPDLFDEWRIHEEELIRVAETGRQFENHPAFPALCGLDSELRAQIVAELEAVENATAVARRRQADWVQCALGEILARQPRAWRELRDRTATHLSAVAALPCQDRVDTPTGIDSRDPLVVKTDAQALLNHLGAGGKLGFGPLRPEPVKRGRYLIETVAIGGRRCDSVGALQELICVLEIDDRVRQLRSLWAHVGLEPIGPHPVQIAGFHDALDTLDLLLEVDQKLTEVEHTFSNAPNLTFPVWHEADSISSLLAAARQAGTLRELELRRTPFDQLERKFRPVNSVDRPHSSIGLLREAIRTRSTDTYSTAYSRICQTETHREAIARGQFLQSQLESSAPQLTNALLASVSDAVWDERLGNFEAAWNWARANGWLNRLSDPDAEQRLSNDISTLRDSSLTATRSLAAELAWQHCFARMTEGERRNLMAWMAAMRRIGKGTGKRAAQHRRDARIHMDECRSAIPGWIMPIYRVAETVRPGTDAFDVVIVDEASQSGPEALFLQFLAKQVVVVGDDKQISPEFIGINRDDVDILRKRHLQGVPHSDALGMDNSFFDQAVIRYGGRIRLREHFRCMPEIIQFSNNLSYRSEPLIPLRQYGIDRLPPIQVRHVPDGYRDGTDSRAVNPPEAQAIVDQLIECCSDPPYDGLSMGVISLQGPHQARKIESLLLEQLGPEEMERRKIVCGDAYDFQGDERDVMFLSLVAAPSHRIGTLSSARDERRFNVAVSRARDQLWLFHTATLNDLSPKCLRYRLLEYCQNPTVEQIDLGITEVPEDRQVEPFDSIFEQHVYRRIVARGYRVIPQFEIAGYRIDLVIEGMRGRLAVECDGDYWHGPDEFASDMARQRQLERCGWTFWRVTGSQFYRNSDKSLESLWETLGRLGIYPDAATVTNDNSQREQSRATVLSDHKGTESGDDFWPHKQSSQEVDNLAEQFDGIALDEDVETEVAGGPSVVDLFGEYEQWQKRSLPHPCNSSIELVLDSLLEIIEAEGPMTCRRAFEVYLISCNIGEMTAPLKRQLNRALYKGVQKRMLASRDEIGSEGQIDRIVWVAGTPDVRIRLRGPRTLDVIPPSEICTAMRAIAELNGDDLGHNSVSYFSQILSVYGLEYSPDSEWQSIIFQRALSQCGSNGQAGSSRTQLGLLPSE